MEIHKRVRQIRLSKGIKQSYVAERIGVSKASYCHFENGRRSLKADQLKVLADALGVKPQDFFKE
jgi:transcriptional regulator with XRE-family HTH domain